MRAELSTDHRLHRRRRDPSEHEPSLGSADNLTNQTKWAAGPTSNEWDIDREGDEHDGREPDVDDEEGGDDEPSLGAQEPSEPDPLQGYFWGSKFMLPDDDDRAAVYDQTSWFRFDDTDREDEHDGREPDDTGIGDSGGLAEQMGGAV